MTDYQLSALCAASSLACIAFAHIVHRRTAQRRQPHLRLPYQTHLTAINDDGVTRVTETTKQS